MASLAYDQSITNLARTLSDNDYTIPINSKEEIDHYFKIATEQGVSALLATRLGNHQESELLHYFRDLLIRQCRGQALHHMAMGVSLKKYLDLMAAHKIPCLLLKGTPIGEQFYEDEYARVRSDVDVLIPVNIVDKVIVILKDNNYLVSDCTRNRAINKQFSAKFNNKKFSTVFDIHWKISNRTLFSDILNFKDCWKERRLLGGIAENAYTLSTVDLLIHACIHRIAHGRNADRNRLIWIYDIHRIITSISKDDLFEFRDKVLKKKIGVVCQDALVTSHSFYGTKLPQEFMASLGVNSDSEPSSSLVKAGKYRWLCSDVLALDTLKERKNYLMGVINSKMRSS